MKTIKTIKQIAAEYQEERLRLGRKWADNRKNGVKAYKATVEIKKAFKQEEGKV